VKCSIRPWYSTSPTGRIFFRQCLALRSIAGEAQDHGVMIVALSA
jgi:hypothetical protein